MIITPEWLKEKGACPEPIRMLRDQHPEGFDAIEVLKGIPERKRGDWDVWLIRKAGQECPELYGPNGEKVFALIDKLPKLPYFKPVKEERIKVAALVQQHLQCLNKFGCPQMAPVKFTSDLDAAWDAAWDAA